MSTSKTSYSVKYEHGTTAVITFDRFIGHGEFHTKMVSLTHQPGKVIAESLWADTGDVSCNRRQIIRGQFDQTTGEWKLDNDSVTSEGGGMLPSLNKQDWRCLREPLMTIGIQQIMIDIRGGIGKNVAQAIIAASIEKRLRNCGVDRASNTIQETTSPQEWPATSRRQTNTNY